MQTKFIGIFGLVLLLTLTSACTATAGDSVDEGPVIVAVEAFFDSLVEADNRRAYSLLSSSSQEQVSYEEFRADREAAISSGRGLSDYTVLGVEPVAGFSPGRRVRVPVRLEHAQGDISETTMSVVSEDGEWRLEFRP